MNKIYSSSVGQNGLSNEFVEYTGSSRIRQTWNTRMMVIALLFMISLFGSYTGFAQSISNYAFTTGTSGSLEDLSSGSTNYLIGNNDDAAGTVQALGFDFVFMGVRYSHFSANSNGQMRLHASATETAIPSSGTTGSTPALGIATLAPFAGDNEVNNGMRFKVIGTAPNRTFILEWNQFYVNYINLSNAGNMQVRLDETSGKITYMYGEIYNSSTSSQTRSIVLASSNTASTVGSITIGAPSTFVEGLTPVVNTIAAGANPVGVALIANIGSAANGSRVFFTFTPPSVVSGDVATLTFNPVSPNSTTVNWIDNATNEFGFLVSRATDLAFTQNVTTASVASTTSVGTGTAYTSAQTGLIPGTTYYYKVVALVEGGSSTGISGNQMTLPPGAITAVATGNWSDTATWSTGLVPTSIDNVTIPAGTTVTVDVVAASTLSLMMQGNLVYSAVTARTLTVGLHVTIDSGGSIKSAATGTVTSHSLVIGGNFTNNGTLDFSTNTNTAGATITFTNTGNANFTLGASSVTNLRNATGITLNKGTSRTNVLTFNPGGTLTVQGANALGFMVITNGLLKLDGTNTFSNPLFATNGYTIAVNGGYWQNNPNATIIGLGGSPTIIGLFRLSSGIFNIGTSTGNSMGFSANSTIIIEGGTINAASRFGVASSSNLINYTQTGGVINVNQIGNTSTTLASFDLGTSVASVINFTAGTVNVVLANTVTSGPRDVRGTNVFLPNFTGTGMINFGTAASGAIPLTYFISGIVPAFTLSTTSAIHNLSLSAGAQTFATATIPVGSTLNLNGYLFILRGSSLINNGTLTGTTAGSTLYYFAGNTVQSYTGTGVCTPGLVNLTVDTAPNALTIGAASSGLNPLRVNLFSGNIINSDKITIGTGLALATVIQVGVAANLNPGGSFDVSPTWNLGTGTQALLYSQETIARTSGFEINPTRVVNALTVDNANGVTIAGGDLTTVTALTLTNGIVTTGTNTLQLGNATTVGTLTGGTATAYVNGFLTRSIATANTNSNYITFPIGKSGVYTPVAIAPATTSIALFKAASFASNTGTSSASITGLSTTRRFEALPVSGTFTDINVRLTDAGIVTGNIPVQAPTAAGMYSDTFGSTAAFVAGPPITLTSTTPVSSANYSGYLSFANAGGCSGTPTPGNTIASSTTICLGATVALSLQNSTAGSGVSYQWKSSPNGTTYTAIIGATTSTLSVKPTAATYYLCEVTCATGSVTGTSTAVYVTFTNMVTSTTAAARCGVGTVILGATPNAGATINWYANPLGGVALASGASFTTPSISTTTTYYAAAEVASPIVQGTVGTGTTLTSTSSNNSVFCNYWATGWRQMVYTASELTAAGLSAGTITALTFNIATLPVAGTVNNFAIRLGVSANSTLTSTFTTVGLSNGFGPVNYTPVLGLNTITLTTPYTWDGVSNILIDIREDGQYDDANSQTYSSTTPTTTVVFGNASGSVPSPAYYTSNPTGSTSSLRPNVVFTSQPSCSSPRVAVLATIATPPVLTINTNALSICNESSSSAVTVTSTLADFDTYTWSPATGVSGNSTIGWIFNPTVTTTYTLTATQTSGSLCAADATVVVTVNPLPTVAITSSTSSICGNSVDSVLLTTGAITSMDGGCLTATALYPAATYTPAVLDDVMVSIITTAGWAGEYSNVNVLNGYTYTFTSSNTADYITIGNATGTIVFAAGLTPLRWTSSSDQVIRFYTYADANCGGQQASRVRSLTGKLTSPAVWSPSTNLFLDAATTMPYLGTAEITVYAKPTSTATYTATATTAAGCSASANTTITVNTVTAPTASAQSFCTSGTVADLVATTGTNLKWYADMTGGSALASTTTLVTGTTYYVSQTVAGCESTRTSVAVTINVTAAPTASAQTFCGTASVADLVATTGTNLKWYADMTGGSALVSTTALATGTYYVSQTVAGCESTRTSVAVTVNVTDVPTASAQTFCGTASIADLVATTGTNLQWYADMTGGNALISTTALATGTYYVSQTVAGCESTRTSVAVTVNVTAAPTASAQTFCNSASVASLVATTGTNLQWYADMTGGSALVSTTALATGTYYVSQTVAGCESARTSVAVTINVTDVPTASAQSFCNTATVANLVATTGTNLKWYADMTGGSALVSTTALATGTYYVSQTISGCESTRTSVAVTVNVIAAPTGNAVQDFTTGQTLANFTVVGQNIIWYSSATGNTVLPSSSVLASGVTYYASQTVNGCESTPRLAVTAGSDLKTSEFEISNLRYYPNPVQDILTVDYSEAIEGVQMYNMLGQQVYFRNTNSSKVTIDMGAMATGNYILQVTVKGITKNVKVIKK